MPVTSSLLIVALIVGFPVVVCALRALTNGYSAPSEVADVEHGPVLYDYEIHGL